MFLGDDLLAWMVLAVGGAMAVGSFYALIRPPDHRRHEDDLERAPLGRSLLFVALGAVAAIWAIGSLISS